MVDHITIRTDTLAALLALTSVGVGSEARGEQGTVEAIRAATECVLRRLGIDPEEFAAMVHNAAERLTSTPERTPRDVN